MQGDIPIVGEILFRSKTPSRERGITLSSRPTSGQPAYQGYEYQILVTVWVALLLMMHGQEASEIEVEPASQEDVAVDLDVGPEHAQSNLSVPCARTSLQIQIKLRGSGPWTVGEFAELLQGRETRNTRGPKPRARPLQILMDEPNSRYLLITNAAVPGALLPYAIEQIGGLSSASKLPAKIKVTGNQADIPARIGILPGQSDRLLTLEINDLLMRVCLVPSVSAEACLRELKECVRDRLLGNDQPTWSREELIMVLERHGRRPAPSEEPFVAPRNFDQLEELLTKQNCLILTGPPGAGKTTIARALVNRHRSIPTPYVVVTKAERVEGIRTALRMPGRHLFFLEDPWGHGELAPDAQLWLNELPKLLMEADPDKRFLVTSRASTLAEALGPAQPPLWLIDNGAKLDANHYDKDHRWQLLLAYMKGARPWQFDFVTAHRPNILGHLVLPYSISLFAKRLLRVDSEDQANLVKMLEDSNLEVVSSTVAREIRELSWSSAVHSAVALWAQLTGDQIVSEANASHLRRIIHKTDPSLSIDVLKIVRWMQQSGWLTQQDGGYHAHPLVISGLESLVDGEMTIAEDTVQALLSALVAEGQVKEVVRILPHLLARKHLQISSEIKASVTQYLVEEALGAEERGPFTRAFRDLQRFSVGDDPVSVLARTLTVKNIRGDVVPIWRHSATKLESIRKSDSARSVTGKFLRWVLPWTDDYFGPPLLSFFMKDLGWDISLELEEAACAVVGTPTLNASLVLDGALTGQEPPFDRLITELVDQNQRASTWWDQHRESYRRAEQAEVDLDVASRITEEPTDWFEPITEALQRVVAERRRREGFGWLVATVPNEDLLTAWASAITPKDPAGVDELNALLKSCVTAPARAWQAVTRSGLREMIPPLLSALGQVPYDDLHSCLRALIGLVTPKELAQYIRGPGAKLPLGHRATMYELRFSLDSEGKQGKHRHVAALGAALSPLEEAAIQASRQAVTEKRNQISTLVPGIGAVLEELVSTAPPLLAAKALTALAVLGQPVLDPAKRFLECADYAVRMCALIAIATDQSSEGVTLLKTGLTDSDYRCRRSAMALLAQKDSGHAPLILGLESDPSGPVRETCALLINTYGWVEGLPVLCRLLYDQRDKNADSFSQSGPIYHVARAAASAFADFQELPPAITTQVCDFLEKGVQATRDVVVRYRLIRAVGLASNREIPLRLILYLDDPTRMEGMYHTGYPLRYAAAWALTYQLLTRPEQRGERDPEKFAGAARHSDGRLAGPALFALGLLGERALITMRTVLRGNEATKMRVVLGVTACLLVKAPLSEELLQELLPNGYPGLRIVRWMTSTQATDEAAWQSLLQKDKEIRTWIDSIQATTDINPALRLALHLLSGQKITSGLESDDRHQHELAKQMEVMTLHTMFGGE
jgi:HEAT repeat protein